MAATKQSGNWNKIYNSILINCTESLYFWNPKLTIASWDNPKLLRFFKNPLKLSLGLSQDALFRKKNTVGCS